MGTPSPWCQGRACVPAARRGSHPSSGTPGFQSLQLSTSCRACPPRTSSSTHPAWCSVARLYRGRRCRTMSSSRQCRCRLRPGHLLRLQALAAQLGTAPSLGTDRLLDRAQCTWSAEAVIPAPETRPLWLVRESQAATMITLPASPLLWGTQSEEKVPWPGRRGRNARDRVVPRV